MGTSSFQRKISAPNQNNDKQETSSQQSSFTDKRESTDEITQLQSSVDNSSNTQEITQLQEKANNNTGMPDDLKQGIESLSGQDMSDVKVTYNSDKPVQLQAHAYANGNDIHIAPGQEKHLPHEAWHVVQQKQGRVQPTTQVNGAPINDDNGLESEADKMGQKALQLKSHNSNNLNIAQNTNSIFQLKKSADLPPVGQVHEEETGKVVDEGETESEKEVKAAVHATGKAKEKSDEARKKTSEAANAEIKKPRDIFEKAGGEVILKLREHKQLINLVKRLGAETDKSKAVFWASHELIINDDNLTLLMQNDAMLMAQAFARETKAKTLEMTEAGYTLDKIAPFNTLIERFKFLYETEGLGFEIIKDECKKRELPIPGKDIEDLYKFSIKDKINRIKKNVNSIIKKEFENIEFLLSDDQEKELGKSKTGAAGTFWNIISKKFSDGVSGEACSVHGVKYEFTLDDEKKSEDIPSKKEIWGWTTWMSTERGQLLTRMGDKEGDVKTIVSFFTDKIIAIFNDDKTKEVHFNSLNDYRKAYEEKYKKPSELTKIPVVKDTISERYEQTLKTVNMKRPNDQKLKKHDSQKFAKVVDVITGNIIEEVNKA